MSLSKRYQWMKPCRMTVWVTRDVGLIRKELSSLWSELRWLLPHTDGLTFQPLPSCPDRRTVSSKNSALESHEICVCVCFQSLPYEVPMHRPGKITQHLACLQGSHMILNLSRFKCAKLGTKMLLSWRITDNTEHDL